MGNNLVRTSSGVWKQEEPAQPATEVRPAPSRTPPRGLPTAANARAAALIELARSDLAQGRLASAETNFRLALTFSPGDPQVASELRGVVQLRDEARRESGPRIR